MAKIGLKIIESNRQISALINKALEKQIDDYIGRRVSNILKEIKIIARQALQNSPEILSLQSGTLKADFGLTSDPTSSIINSILATLTIDITKTRTTNTSITGGFTIKMQPNDYGNLYFLASAKQAIKDGYLPWLKWLLELGDTIVIVNYGVEYGTFGRTGMAHMTEDTRPFKVNSSYSGTKNNNFITRAFADSEQEITNAIIRIMK